MRDLIIGKQTITGKLSAEALGGVLSEKKRQAIFLQVPSDGRKDYSEVLAA